MRPTNLGDVIDPERDAGLTALIEPGPHDARHYSYGEIDEAARAVARALIGRGLETGDRVAILAANSVRYLMAYFGIMRAGLIAVPVNFKLPRALVDHVVGDSGARLAFVDTDRLPQLPDNLPRIVLDGQGADGYENFLDPGPFETATPSPDDIAMFLYTSGSSGRPKGVPLSHAGQLWVIETRLRLGQDLDRHRLLVAAPLYHMNGLAISTFALAAHASEVLLTQFRADDYIKAIEQFGCSWLTSVPTMLALLAQETALLEATDLSSVRIVAMGSAPVSDNLMATLQERFSGCAFVNGFGTTETGAICFGAHPDDLPRPLVSLGHPISGIDVRLVADGENEPDEGVLHIRSPALMTGYHNLPEKTAEVMTDDGYFVTGDVMRRDENGFFYFVGRDDDMFVCGGENIVPAAIERMLETHPDIEQACVVPVADEIRGHMPVAYVVRRSDSDLAEQSVKDFALANATPQEHPRRVFFLDVLPLAGTNKIDRHALTQRAAQELRS
ncbi:MAG: acyl--CoA ligase [Rhodospirillaceae bacterium]|jgi:long-chain acyl-CoA synthetase|nr:acyl--CoA ligase [Rhodospirillaceae bacterium]MBT5456937.1 acyl--CoA ligase [Rhodospirillaceae bacterium]